MKKSERLIHLLELLNQQESMSLSEIVSRCSISERTAYRDLKLLSELGFPIKQDEGYRLEQVTLHSVFNKFSDDELRLIRFALQTHLLVEALPFKRLSERLNKNRLVDKESVADKRQDEIHLIDNPGNYPRFESLGSAIPKFLKAIEEKRLVKIQQRSSESSLRYIPLAIQMKSGDLLLVVSVLSRTNLLKFSIYDVKQLDLLDERFDRRPIELLKSKSN